MSICLGLLALSGALFLLVMSLRVFIVTLLDITKLPPEFWR